METLITVEQRNYAIRSVRTFDSSLVSAEMWNNFEITELRQLSKAGNSSIALKFPAEFSAQFSSSTGKKVTKTRIGDARATRFVETGPEITADSVSMTVT